MKARRSLLAVVVFLFVVVVVAACATAPPAPGLKFEVGEQAQMHNAKGLEYADKGMYQQAIEEYKKAIVLAPSYAEAYTNCSKAYYAIGDSDMSLYYVLKRDDIITQKERAIRESQELDGDKPAAEEEKKGM